MIYGICGKAQSGKSTLAGVLVEEFGFLEMAFADKLKDICSSLLPGNRYEHYHNMMHGSNEEKNKEIPEIGLTYRQLLQKVGVALREIEPGIWIHAIKNGVQAAHQEADIVISDVRFDNEAKYIKDQGGKIIMVERPNSTAYVPDHISEKGIDNKHIDMTVINSAETEQDYREDIIAIFSCSLL